MNASQPAWVLSRKNYGDNGMLVEFFSAELGRCGAVVRGAHRRKQGGSLASILQPFHPLLITLAGRSELKTLRMAEAPTPGYLLRGDALMSGLYLNELLVRSLQRLDALPTLFLAYGRAIESLRQAVAQESLRRFELILLSELGYRIAWDSDEYQEPIKFEESYHFIPNRGFFVAESSTNLSLNELLLSGAQIMRVRQWWEREESLTPEELSLLKRVTRVAITELTGGRAIRAREFVKGLKTTGRGAQS